MAWRIDLEEHGQAGNRPLMLIEVDGELHLLDLPARKKLFDELGLVAKTQLYTGTDPREFLISDHMLGGYTKSQKAYFGVRYLLPEESALASKRRRAGVAWSQAQVGKQGKAAKAAARRLGVGTSLIEDATRIQRADPSLFAKLRTGEQTVGGALRKLRKGNQKSRQQSRHVTEDAGDERDHLLFRIEILAADAEAIEKDAGIIQPENAATASELVLRSRDCLDRAATRIMEV